MNKTNEQMEEIYIEFMKEKIPFHFEEVIDKIPRLEIGPFRHLRGSSYESFLQIRQKIEILCKMNHKQMIYSGLEPDDNNTYQTSIYIYNVSDEEWKNRKLHQKMKKYEDQEYSPTSEDIQFLQNTIFKDPDTFFQQIHKDLSKKYFMELMFETWSPDRVEDWCL